MVAISMISQKRFFWSSITFIWVCISIIFIYVIDKPNNYNDSIITINDNKIAYKIFYTPLRWLDIKSFVDISSKNEMCNKYRKEGIIDIKYQHNGKLYTVDKYGSFDINADFKYKDPIKIILKAKKDIEKCAFHVYMYPGKLNMILTGIIFFLLPIFLSFVNIFLPSIKYFKRNRKK